MTLQERKKKIIDKIELLSEEQITTFENLLLELESEEERNERVKSILKKDFSRFKETFKAL